MRIKFLLLSLSFTHLIVAQNKNDVSKGLKEFNNDTAKYIEQRIISKRNCYEGQPLDSLLKDLPKIINYANGDSPRNVSIYDATVLYFASHRAVMDKLEQKKFPMVLTITWATPLNNNDLPALGLKIGGGEWTETAYKYYKNKIIGKIEIIQYKAQ